MRQRYLCRVSTFPTPVLPTTTVMLELSRISLLMAIAPVAQTILREQTRAGGLVPVSPHAVARTAVPRQVARTLADQSFDQAPFFTPLFVESLASLSSFTANLSDLDQPLHVFKDVAAHACA